MQALAATSTATELTFDLSGLTRLDTAGAWLLHRTQRQLQREARTVNLVGLSPEAEGMLALVTVLDAAVVNAPPSPKTGMIEGVGRKAVERVSEHLGFFSFLGETMLTLAPALWRPMRIRWKMLLHELGAAGYQALPIVGLLAFLLGVVIAYQGGVQLRQYGASVFIADLVGFSMLRELAPLIAAIIVAGRTGSSYTAQIGTMKVSEEIDAMRTMGIMPIEQLVIPKLLALLIALPLLTIYADMTGLLGGMLMSSSLLGVSPTTFVDRLGDALNLPALWIGIGKAPVFAALISLVGCYQGFRVSGSAESVGRRTTISVVQSIFLVIVVDAVFSVIFSWLDI